VSSKNTIYNNNLIIGSIIENTDHTYGIAQWNGATMSSIPVNKNDKLTINAMAEYHNDLIVAGRFDSIGGIRAKNIARWNGVTWAAFAGGDIVQNGSNYGAIYALEVDKVNDILYASGDFDRVGSAVISGIVKYTEPVGVNEIKDKVLIKVFPNPAINIFNIENNNIPCRIEIYNILGDLIHVSNLKFGLNTLNVESFSTGAYIYKIISTKSEIIKIDKLIVVK
jgi:hypothetical protein